MALRSVFLLWDVTLTLHQDYKILAAFSKRRGLDCHRDRVVTERVSLADLRALLAGAVAVALISLADISELSRIFAARAICGEAQGPH